MLRSLQSIFLGRRPRTSKGKHMSKIKTGIVRLVLGASILAVTGSAFAAPPTLHLPPNPPGPYKGNLTFASDFSLGSYFTSVFGTPPIPANLDVVQGATYKAWCVEFNDDIVFSGGPIIFTATNAGPFTFRNTLDPTSLPTDALSPNWGAVNWILNNKPSGPNSVIDTQEALWFLLDGAFHTNQFISPVEPILPSTATALLISNALANATFVPGPGQIIGVLLDGGDGLTNNGSDVQSLLIEVPAPRLTVVKTADSATVTHGNKVGFTVTISNT